MVLCCVTSPSISVAPEIDVDAYLSDAGYPYDLIAEMDNAMKQDFYVNQCTYASHHSSSSTWAEMTEGQAGLDSTIDPVIFYKNHIVSDVPISGGNPNNLRRRRVTYTWYLMQNPSWTLTEWNAP